MTRTKAVAAVPLGAFRAGVTLLERYCKDRAWLAAEYGAKPATVGAWLAGTKAPTPNHIAGVLRMLTWIAETRTDAEESAPFVAAARAIDPGGYVLAYRRIRQRLVLEHRIEPQRWTAGIHFLPCRDEEHRPLLAEIGDDGRLVALVPFDFKSPDRAKIAAKMLTRGIAVAPWLPSCERGEHGHVLLAIDSETRLRAMVEVPPDHTGTSLIDAYDDLMAALEVLDSPSVDDGKSDTVNDDAARYSDGYARNDDEDERGFDRGDVWLKGTIYDVSQRRDDDEGATGCS